MTPIPGRRTVVRALAKHLLPPERRLVMLRYADELTEHEIAIVLGVTPDRVTHELAGVRRLALAGLWCWSIV